MKLFFLLTILLCTQQNLYAQNALWAVQRAKTIAQTPDPLTQCENLCDTSKEYKNIDERENRSGTKKVISLKNLEGFTDFTFSGATLTPRIKALAGLYGVHNKDDGDKIFRTYSNLSLGGLQVPNESDYFDQAGSLFIPEKSFWYFDMQGGLIFGKKKILVAWHNHLNFSGKKISLPEDRMEGLPAELTPNVAFVNSGIQFVFFETFMFHGSYTYSSILTDYGNSRSYFNYDYGENWFFKGGVSAILNVKKVDEEQTDPVKFRFDLSGIILTDRMRTMMNTRDRVLPIVQIGAVIPFLPHK